MHMYIGSLGSASIFTTKIIFKSQFSSAREFKNDFLKWLAHKNGRLKTFKFIEGKFGRCL